MTWERTNNQSNIDTLYSDYQNGRINLQPEYQRGLVWTRPMMQYLMWCILRDRDINHFYLHARSGKKGKFWFDVVDGQQRLNSIFMYLNDEYTLARSRPNLKHRTSPEDDGMINGEKVVGLKFSALSEELQTQIRLYPIHSSIISSDDNQSVIEQFVDLQSSKALTPQQIREAYPCALNDAIRAAEKHSMIDKMTFIRGKSSAGARQFLSRLFAYERAHQLIGTDATLLTSLYLASRFSVISNKEIDQWYRNVIATLDTMYSVFKEADYVVYSGHMLLVYWLIKTLPADGIDPMRHARQIRDWYRSDWEQLAIYYEKKRRTLESTPIIENTYMEMRHRFMDSIAQKATNGKVLQR